MGETYANAIDNLAKGESEPIPTAAPIPTGKAKPEPKAKGGKKNGKKAA